MKNSLGRIICLSLIVTLSLSSSLLAQEKQPKDASAVLKEMAGTVDAYRITTDEWEEAKKGERYMAKDALSTDEASHALLEFHDNHRLEMKENTEMTIRQLYRRTDTGEEGTVIDLTVGEILNRVKDLPTEGSIYTIHTPTATSSVRGTRFRVRVFKVEEEWYTEVQVLDGIVEVTDQAGKMLEMTDGQEADISTLGVPGAATTMDSETKGDLEQGFEGLETGAMDLGDLDSTDLEMGIESIEEQVEAEIETIEADIEEPPEIDPDDDNDSDLF